MLVLKDNCVEIIQFQFCNKRLQYVQEISLKLIVHQNDD